MAKMTLEQLPTNLARLFPSGGLDEVGKEALLLELGIKSHLDKAKAMGKNLNELFIDVELPTLPKNARMEDIPILKKQLQKLNLGDKVAKATGMYQQEIIYYSENSLNKIQEMIDPKPVSLFSSEEQAFLEAAGDFLIIGVDISVNLPFDAKKKWTLEEFKAANPNWIEKIKSQIYDYAAPNWEGWKKKKSFTSSNETVWMDKSGIKEKMENINKLLNYRNDKKGSFQEMPLYKQFINGKDNLHLGINDLKKQFEKDPNSGPILKSLETSVLSDLEEFRKEANELEKKKKEAAAAGNTGNYNLLTDLAFKVRVLEKRVNDYHKDVLPKKIIVAEQQIVLAKKLREIKGKEKSPKVIYEFLSRIPVIKGDMVLDDARKAGLNNSYDQFNNSWAELNKLIRDKTKKEDITVEEAESIYDKEFTEKLEKLYVRGEQYCLKYLEASINDEYLTEREPLNKKFNSLLLEFDENLKNSARPEDRGYYKTSAEKLTSEISNQIGEFVKYNEALGKKQEKFKNQFQKRFENQPGFEKLQEEKFKNIRDQVEALTLELNHLKVESGKIKDYYHFDFFEKRKKEIEESIKSVKDKLLTLNKQAENLEKELLVNGLSQEKNKENPYFRSYSLTDKKEWPKDNEKKSMHENLMRERETVFKDQATLNDVHQPRAEAIIQKINTLAIEYSQDTSMVVDSFGITEELLRKHNQLKDAILDYHVFKEKLKFDPVQAFSFNVSNVDNYLKGLQSLKAQGNPMSDVIKMYQPIVDQICVLEEVNELRKEKKLPPITLKINIAYPSDKSDQTAIKETTAYNQTAKESFASSITAEVSKYIRVESSDTNMEAFKKLMSEKVNTAINTISEIEINKNKFLEELTKKINDLSPGMNEVVREDILKKLKDIIDKNISCPTLRDVQYGQEGMQNNFSSYAITEFLKTANKVRRASEKLNDISKSLDKYGLDESSLKNIIDDQIVNNQFDDILFGGKLISNVVELPFLKQELKIWSEEHNKLPDAAKAEMDKRYEVVNKLSSFKNRLEKESEFDDSEIERALIDLRDYHVYLNRVGRDLKTPYSFDEKLSRMNKTAEEVNEKYRGAEKLFAPIRQGYGEIQKEIDKAINKIKELNDKKKAFESDFLRYQSILKGSGGDWNLSEYQSAKFFEKQNQIYEKTIGSIPKEEDVRNIYPDLKVLKELYDEIEKAYKNMDPGLSALCEKYNKLLGDVKVRNEMLSKISSQITQTETNISIKTKSITKQVGYQKWVETFASDSEKGKIAVEYNCERLLYSGALDHVGRIKFIETELTKIVSPPNTRSQAEQDNLEYKYDEIVKFIDDLKKPSSKDRMNEIEAGKKLLLDYYKSKIDKQYEKDPSAKSDKYSESPIVRGFIDAANNTARKIFDSQPKVKEELQGKFINEYSKLDDSQRVEFLKIELKIALESYRKLSNDSKENLKEEHDRCETALELHLKGREPLGGVRSILENLATLHDKISKSPDNKDQFYISNLMQSITQNANGLIEKQNKELLTAKNVDALQKMDELEIRRNFRSLYASLSADPNGYNNKLKFFTEVIDKIKNENRDKNKLKDLPQEAQIELQQMAGDLPDLDVNFKGHESEGPFSIHFSDPEGQILEYYYNYNRRMNDYNLQKKQLGQALINRPIKEEIIEDLRSTAAKIGVPEGTLRKLPPVESVKLSTTVKVGAPSLVSSLSTSAGPRPQDADKPKVEPKIASTATMTTPQVKPNISSTSAMTTPPVETKIKPPPVIVESKKGEALKGANAGVTGTTVDTSKPAEARKEPGTTVGTSKPAAARSEPATEIEVHKVQFRNSLELMQALQQKIGVAATAEVLKTESLAEPLSRVNLINSVLKKDPPFFEISLNIPKSDKGINVEELISQNKSQFETFNNNTKSVVKGKEGELSNILTNRRNNSTEMVRKLLEGIEGLGRKLNRKLDEETKPLSDFIEQYEVDLIFETQFDTSLNNFVTEPNSENTSDLSKYINNLDEMERLITNYEINPQSYIGKLEIKYYFETELEKRDLDTRAEFFRNQVNKINGIYNSLNDNYKSALKNSYLEVKGMYENENIHKTPNPEVFKNFYYQLIDLEPSYMSRILEDSSKKSAVLSSQASSAESGTNYPENVVDLKSVRDAKPSFSSKQAVSDTGPTVSDLGPVKQQVVESNLAGLNGRTTQENKEILINMGIAENEVEKFFNKEIVKEVFRLRNIREKITGRWRPFDLDMPNKPITSDKLYSMNAVVLEKQLKETQDLIQNIGKRTCNIAKGKVIASLKTDIAGRKEKIRETLSQISREGRVIVGIESIEDTLQNIPTPESLDKAIEEIEKNKDNRDGKLHAIQKYASMLDAIENSEDTLSNIEEQIEETIAAAASKKSTSTATKGRIPSGTIDQSGRKAPVVDLKTQADKSITSENLSSRLSAAQVDTAKLGENYPPGSKREAISTQFNISSAGQTGNTTAVKASLTESKGRGEEETKGLHETVAMQGNVNSKDSYIEIATATVNAYEAELLNNPKLVKELGLQIQMKDTNVKPEEKIKSEIKANAEAQRKSINTNQEFSFQMENPTTKSKSEVKNKFNSKNNTVDVTIDNPDDNTIIVAMKNSIKFAPLTMETNPESALALFEAAILVGYPKEHLDTLLGKEDKAYLEGKTQPKVSDEIKNYYANLQKIVKDAIDKNEEPQNRLLELRADRTGKDLELGGNPDLKKPPTKTVRFNF